MTSIPLVPVARPTLWRSAQWIGLALTSALLVSLVAAPKPALHVLWDMVIPFLPAVFLVNPLVWRNVCPLATLNTLTGDRYGRREMSAAIAAPAWIAGMLLLALMVPARRFLFNVDGPVLAATIVVVALLAAGAGLAFARHGGFCNAICPVLPVEKLYGQAPLVDVGSSRCATCTVCTPVGCIELARGKTVAQTLGPTRRAHGWLATPFGVFAAAFPGFIIAYFSETNGSFAIAGSVYLHVAQYALASYVLAAAMVWALRIPALVATLLLGAISLGLYYWFAAPALGAAYGAPEVGPAVVRLVAFTLIAVWLWRATRRAAASVR